MIHSVLRSGLITMSRSRGLAHFATSNRLAWGAASRFIAGQSIDEAVEVVRRLNDEGFLVTLDHLGENVDSEAAAAASADAYVEAIDRSAAAGVDTWISLKLTALGLDLGDQLAESLLRRVMERAAREDPPIFVRIDMEASAYTQRTLDLFYKVYRDYRHLGTVIQTYLYRSDRDVADLIEAGSGPRLVKGAYLEPAEIAYPDKADVDAAFLRMSQALLSEEARAKDVYPAFATQDDAIIGWIKAHAEERGLARESYEFQMLFGVRRDLQRQLVDEGYRVRVYVPYGSQWYPYFMRRLAERPENVAFMVRNLMREGRS